MKLRGAGGGSRGGGGAVVPQVSSPKNYQLPYGVAQWGGQGLRLRAFFFNHAFDILAGRFEAKKFSKKTYSGGFADRLKASASLYHLPLA